MSSTVPVPPLLPQCVDLNAADFDPIQASRFDPTSLEYYKELLPTVAPGIALGAAALLGFIISVIWMLMHCACCGCGRSDDDDIEAKTQFIQQQGTRTHGNYTYGISGAPARTPPPKHRRCTCRGVLQVLIVIMTLATIGVCAWGIEVSIANTSSQVSEFWDIVDGVDSRVENVTITLRSVSGQLLELQTSVDTLSSNSAELTAASQQLGDLSAKLQGAVDALEAASGTIDSIRNGLDDGVISVEDNVGNAITDLQDSYKPPTLAFQETWRFVVIAVAFGLTILMAAVSGLLSSRIRSPFWAWTCVALLWLCVALLMLLGVGLFQGVYLVSKDTCLYSETFAVSLVNRNVKDPKQRLWVDKALRYYLMPNTTQQAEGSAVNAITGVDTEVLYGLINGPVQDLLTTLNDASVVSALSTVQGGGSTAVQSITTLVVPMTQNLQSLDQQMSRNSILPLYEQGKSFICCEIAQSSQDLFLPWTIAGCLGFVLAILCSLSLTGHHFWQKPKRT